MTNSSNHHLEEEIGRIALSDSALAFDSDMFVVENKGLVIQDHPNMGRVVVASRDFGTEEIGFSVLVEEPALLCSQEDHMDFMEKFLALPEEVQVGIRDMFYQPLESLMGRSLTEPAKILWMVGMLEDYVEIHELLSIWMTNGMQFGPDQSALALFSSKFSHSCDPNIGFSTSNGMIEFKLLRPIARGELAEISYLTDILETPTFERRQLLLETKGFLCQCSRCMGPDFSRCIKCPTCPEERVPCYYTDLDENPFEPLWACPKCGLVETNIMMCREQEIDNTLELVNREMESISFQKRSQYSPGMLQELVEDCQTKLSPVHHLTIKSLRLLFSLATSLAFDAIKRRLVRGMSLEDSSVHAFFRTSVDAGFALVLAGECCANKCYRCYRTKNGLKISHDANFDRTLPIMHALDNLMQLPVSWWPPIAVDMAKRYLPFLQAKYGKNGAATAILGNEFNSDGESTLDAIREKIIDRFGNAHCFDCGSSWDSSTRLDAGNTNKN